MPSGPTEFGPQATPAGMLERVWCGQAGAWTLPLEVVLTPLELMYRAAAGVYHAGYDIGRLAAIRMPVPTVSVGNISVGGTGKTPFTRWLVGELRQRGRRPAVLHGGYARDEPELHRAWHPDVPVHARRDRVAAGRRAAGDGADVLVLDDGFQHRRIARDLDIALVAAEGWAERPRLLPRGPWREPPTALARADVVGITRRAVGPDAADAVARSIAAFAPAAVVAHIHLKPSGWRTVTGSDRESSDHGALAKGEEVVVVTGIARPDLFVANVRQAGGRVASILAFRDHHAYRPDDITRVRELAAGRPIVTTEKDAVKLTKVAPDLELCILEQKAELEAGGPELAGLLEGVGL